MPLSILIVRISKPARMDQLNLTTFTTAIIVIFIGVVAGCCDDRNPGSDPSVSTVPDYIDEHGLPDLGGKQSGDMFWYCQAEVILPHGGTELTYLYYFDRDEVVVFDTSGEMTVDPIPNEEKEILIQIRDAYASGNTEDLPFPPMELPGGFSMPNEGP